MQVLTRNNQLELRLVKDGPELDAAQALRYEIFYEEMGARPTPAMAARRRDWDRFDNVAEHLVVVDVELSSRLRPHVVGCYRMLRSSVAARHGGLYTAGEFDLSGIAATNGEVMELGRSCVAPSYRTGVVMQLLWKGIVEYLDRYNVGVMLGCASLPGTDPDAVAPVLSYLHHHHLAPPGLRPRALPHRHIRADRLPAEAVDARAVLRGLPPLLKAYLRMGGTIGDGAVIDADFNTIDVCLVLPTAVVEQRYIRHCRQHRTAMPEAA